MVARLEPRPPGLIRSPLFGNDGAPAGKLGDGGIDKQHDPRSDERHEPAYRVVPLVDNRSDAKRAGPLPVSPFYCRYRKKSRLSSLTKDSGGHDVSGV